MRKFFYVLVAIAFVSADARAADWTATKLRGLVFANTVAGDGAWVRLRRGDVVDDARVIRTLANGNVEFQSGAETIAFGPGTEAEIVDRAGRRYTTVVEQAGTVAVSAEALEVPHFSVETPYLVAVVKGTVFTVRTDATGSAVSVSRGLVAVTDRRSRGQVLLPAGRAVVVTADGRAALSGMAIPVLVHPLVGGIVEDADQPGSGSAAAPIAAAAAGGVAAPLGGGLGQNLGKLAAGVGSTVGGLDRATGAVGSAVGTTVSGLGGTIGGLGQTTGAIGTTLGATVGSLGSGVGGLGSATGSIGNTLGATTSVVGNTVSSVGAGVAKIGGTVKSLGAGGSGALGGVTRSVTGTVGGALAGLGL